MNFNYLIKNNILNLKPYQSARRLKHSGKIWLNANEYPIAPYYKGQYKNINRYPECQPPELINNYAAYSGVQSDHILVSRGADESIELLMKVFCRPNKDFIIFCPPTYGMYKTNAEILEIYYRMIPTKKNWQLDLSSIQSQLNNVKLIYICNPNNPTGNIIYLHSLKKLLKIIQNKALLVCDEAYIDFCRHASLIQLLTEYPNLIILRTLSKAFALAGLRCGFTLANPKIINLLTKVITPYPIPTPVIDIATQALTPQNIQYTQTRIKKIHNNRNMLIKALKQCSCVQQIFPSYTNYILVKFYPQYQVFKTLLNQGIVLRDQSYQPGLMHCLRITIGSYNECQLVISTLKKLKHSTF
ncbi:histidinol-phosphate aminotransferase [Candidatus Blochmanniella floridana]|uniref:Histidinol-phosphate aminotransferase n=1 Tax=Blochmanniella floridana TaxID=203907 RepID=HIS8_BLOFL|nr:RecName: Full=Histidinol-phosphate aminotransferase; AltName: Full=Imidazole acetol-phosphate transaminase [Candidatus Blochmannia floridanus]CAD83523.1 histidinol-phosphate aminotransferase [Candidatus Blochmannia floridanus]